MDLVSVDDFVIEQQAHDGIEGCVVLAKDRPLILGGDFNTWVSSFEPAYRTHRRGYS